MSLADPSIVVMASVLICCATAGALFHMRATVFLLMGWLVAEGQIRKLLPGQPPQTMLATDALLLLVYVSCFARELSQATPSQTPTWRPSFLGPLLVFAVICIAQVFNPTSPGLLVGLVGLHSYLWPIPLLWVGYKVFDDWERARKFLFWLMLSSIPLTMLASYQYVHFDKLPAGLMPLQTDFALHSNLAAGEELIQLVPSVFVNAEKFARYCLMTFFLSTGILIDRSSKPRHRITAAVTLAASLAGIFFSGRRSPLYFSVAGLAWLLFGPFRSHLGPRPKQWLVVPAAAVVVLVAAAQVSVIDGKWYRDSVVVVPDRVDLAWSDLRDSFSHSSWLGTGTGTDSQGIDYVSSGRWWNHTSKDSPFGKWGEAGLAMIWIELGLAGVVSFVILLLAMGVAWFRNVRRLRALPSYGLGASLCVFFCMMLLWFAKGHQILGDPITLVHFWFLMGIFFALPAYQYRLPQVPPNSGSHLRIPYLSK